MTRQRQWKDTPDREEKTVEEKRAPTIYVARVGLLLQDMRWSVNPLASV